MHAIPFEMYCDGDLPMGSQEQVHGLSYFQILELSDRRCKALHKLMVHGLSLQERIHLH